jgi:hypothetical protein
MRKFALSALFLLACAALFGQEAKFFISESDHYKVFSETSQSHADEVSGMMEACLSVYNNIFHFDLSAMPGKMQVKVFKTQDTFNAYLTALVSQTRTDFVFVAYSDPLKSELLAFTKEPAAFLSSLIHQAGIQIIKEYIANPPVWLREGIATYFEGSAYDSTTAALTVKPNFLWLDSLKALVKGEGESTLIPISDLLVMSRDAAQSALDVFYPEAWGLVSYLMGASDRNVNRIFWDAISSMDPKASLEENSQRVRTKAFSWIDDSTFEKDFHAFALSMKTGQDLLVDGVDFYSRGDIDEAEKSFRAALIELPSSEVAYYYLGLIAYAEKDYASADQAYQTAATLGVDSGLVNYALGVNAFASGNLADASRYLGLSKSADPTTYGDKVDALLKRISATTSTKD